MTAPDLPEFWPEDGDLSLPPLPRRLSRACRQDRSISPLRFLQASDLRLDTPCEGVAGLPQELGARIAAAPHVAARRVFDAAIDHEVDFVVLAGGLLDARVPGFRGPCFLAEQFRRLADHHIDVYWAGATLETRGRWPSGLDIPPNVHRLSSGEAGMLHGRQGQPIARLLTVPATFAASKPTSAAPFTIAVQSRCDELPELRHRGIDYWALGGQSHHETLQVGEVVAHFAGSPQGRSPAEAGRHSCSLVSVDEDGGVQIRPVQTAVAAWHHQRLQVESGSTWEALQQRCAALLEEYSADHSGNPIPLELTVMTWTVTGAGPALERLLEPQSQVALVQHLNRRSAGREHTVWTSEIQPEVAPAECRLWQGRGPEREKSLELFLRELDELSDHVHELFGTVPAGPHPPGAVGAETNEQIVRQVAAEGLRRLGTNAPFAAPAA